jgi:hypothetical protein
MQRREPIPQLIEEYLARGPESEPMRLLGPTAFVLLRAGILIHGVLVGGWSLLWLAAFLLAELYLVLRLMTFGNRLTGLAREGQAVTTASITLAGIHATLALAIAFVTGLRLADTGGGPLFVDVQLPSTLAVASYLAVELFEFARAVFITRRHGRRFVSSATLSAAFFVIGLALSVLMFMLIQFVTSILGVETAARVSAALSLITAKSGAELGVVWYPWAARKMGLKPRSRALDEERTVHE